MLGKVVRWNDAKGFGFIQPHDGGAQRFFHARDYDDGGHGRPRAGDWVRFVPCQDDQGRDNACTVRPALARRGRTAVRTQRRTRMGQRHALLGWLVLLTYLSGAAWLLHAGRLSKEAIAALAATCLLTWIVYAVDKRAAQAGRRRIPESTLHLLELIGGWAGGYLAQRMLRHKSSKQRYQLVFWGIGLLHMGGMWLMASGSMSVT